MHPLVGAALVFAVTFAALAAARVVRRQPIRTVGPRPVLSVSARAPWQRRAAARAAVAALPGLLDQIANALRAGESLHTAVQAATDATATLSPVLQRVGRGDSLRDALDHWRRSATDPSSRLAATTLMHAAALGGTDPHPFEAAAAALRERAALRGEIRTQAAQARASATVLSALPPAFLAVAAMVDADVAEVVLRTPLGWACVAAGLALDGLGLWWMARLVAGAMP
jgi:tight adherence protein B